MTAGDGLGESGLDAAGDALRRERARYSELLDGMEQRLRLVVDGATDHAIFTIDADRRVTSWSKGAAAIFGYAPEEAIGQSADMIFTPEDCAANVPEAEVATARREGAAPDQRWHMRKDGTRVYMSGSVHPLPRGADGGDQGFIKIARDETAQHRALEAIARSEARFREMANSIDQMVWSTQPDGFHDFYNQRWYDFTGVPEGSTDGEAWNGMFHPDDQERAWARWRHSLTTGEPYEIEYRLRHRSGLYRWVLGRAQALHDATGAIARWYGTCTDIHDQKLTADALRLSERNLRNLNAELERKVVERSGERGLIWQVTPDLIGVCNGEGYFESSNPAWQTVLGWSEEEIRAAPFHSLLHPDDVQRTMEEFERLTHGRPVLRFENRYRTRDGDYRWLSWVSAPDGDRYYCSARDITAEKQQALELEAAQEALRQSQKMEAVGQLTGGIAHDFNNMLAVVIGSLDLAGRRIGDSDARARRYIDAATDGARRAAQLTQRLLAFSRQQPLRPETIDVAKLVTGMSDLIRGSIGPEIRFETVLAGGGWRTHADPNQLENVLLNLAVNARDAMPEGGRLTIETQNADLDPRYAANHPGIVPGQYVLIAVTDTGSGMPEDVIAKAFDPFFTTKAVGKGTGLGLSQVYGFVKQSGGHVKIYSEPGQGTTIKVYLPRLAGAEGERAGTGATQLPRGEGHEVILVVEDEPAVRQLSMDALIELGYRVIEADGAAAALHLIDLHPEIALMFTDVVMPEVNGRKLADQARARRPDLKVLFTTGYTRNAMVHNGVLDRGVQLIGKPYTIEELAAKMREVLDGPAGLG